MEYTISAHASSLSDCNRVLKCDATFIPEKGDKCIFSEYVTFTSVCLLQLWSAPYSHPHLTFLLGTPSGITYVSSFDPFIFRCRSLHCLFLAEDSCIWLPLEPVTLHVSHRGLLKKMFSFPWLRNLLPLLATEHSMFLPAGEWGIKYRTWTQIPPPPQPYSSTIRCC